MVFSKSSRAIGLVAGFALLAIVVGAACRPVDPTPVPQVKAVIAPTVLPTASPVPTRAPTATPPLATCDAGKTPLPTQTPFQNAPASALKVAPKFPPLTGRSAMLDTKFYSPLLAQEMPILIYLPPGYYDSTRSYPVLYMLSGFAGNYHEWADMGICDALESLLRGGIIQPMIVVMPEGGGSYWFNHPATAGSDGKPWGDYIWQDVVNYVDTNYRTIKQKESRAIGGLSAGGQGALMFGLTHPEVFSIIGAHSPSIRHADGSLAFFGTQDFFNQYDPTWLLQNKETWKQITLWLDAAAEDHQWGDAVRELHEQLLEMGMAHDYEDDWHGIHDDYYWAAHIPDYLNWYSSKLVGESQQ